MPIVVVKKGKSREVFDRNKLFNSMLKACEKRPVYMEQLEKAVSEIEAVLQNSLDREISTEKIGELVMERLKPLDEVAYVRFASVYRQVKGKDSFMRGFKDINTFMDELAKLLKEK